jgi:hypothetical protein
MVHVDWFKYCIHLRSSNVCHFRTVDATGLKKYGLEVTFSGMTSLLSFMNSAIWFKSCWWMTHRQTAW